MAIKYTIQGLLIYSVMAVYAAAFFAYVFGKRKLGGTLYYVGFVGAAMGFIYRWYAVGHVPLQNLFEVFIGMGVGIYPISVFCRRFLKVGLEWADIVVGLLLLFAAGFVFSGEAQRLPPALQCWLFGPHVLVYILSYVVMAKAAVQAICQLKYGQESLPDCVDFEDGTYRMVCLGFPLLTLGLILGSVWGKVAWGDYWRWDPKELWSLVSWLMYAAYFHFRLLYGKRYSRINSGIAMLGFAAILITLLLANLSRIFAGLHSYAT